MLQSQSFVTKSKLCYKVKALLQSQSFVTSSKLCYKLYVLSVWARGPWGPLGPRYRIHRESVTTYCQADYLLAGKATYCQACTQPLHRLAPHNRIHASKIRIHAPNYFCIHALNSTPFKQITFYVFLSFCIPTIIMIAYCLCFLSNKQEVAV